jgi:hypothetical protein
MSLYSNDSLYGAQFFVGVVEDRDDPEQLGRVRVRAFGIHTEDKDKIPTDTLPWATPVMPYTSASISGIGTSPTGPVEGTWVIGIFLDGGEMQQPAVLGTIVGNPVEVMDKTKGFSDPEGLYPIIEDDNIFLSNQDGVTEEGESDVSRLARGDTIDHSTINSKRPGEKILAVKSKARIKDIPTAVPPKISTVKDGAPPGKGRRTYRTGFHTDKDYSGNSFEYWDRLKWNEPTARYGGQNEDAPAPINLDETIRGSARAIDPLKSKYPLNHVHVTERGHVFEVDDSPNAERIHQYHSKGTYTEIQPNGTRVTKVVGDDYEIVMHDKNVLVSGNVNITVDGGDLRLYVKKEDGAEKGGDMYIETDGDLNLNIKGDMNTKIIGTESKEVSSDSATNITGKRNLRVGKTMNHSVQGDHTLTNHSNYSVITTGYAMMTGTQGFNISAGLGMTLTSATDMKLVAATNLKLEGVVKADLQSALIDIGSTTAGTTIASIYGALVNVGAATTTKVDVKAIAIDIDASAIVNIDGARIDLN